MMRRSIVSAMLHIITLVTVFSSVQSTFAGSLQEHQTKHLLVFDDSFLNQVSEKEVVALCSRARGRLLVWHSAIGTALATSKTSSFAKDAMAMEPRLRSVGVTGAMPIGRTTRIPEYNMRKVDVSVEDISSQRSRVLSYNWGDSLSNKQWDMVQTGVNRAHTITTGRSDVVVGVIDTGADYNHPDLKSTLDFSHSLSCVSGVKNYSRSAWKDMEGHGTHTASTVAAASNGRGIVGVAPGARIAAIKACTPDGLFYAEAMVCAFMHIADSGMAVASNSLFVDPWYFTCKNKSPQDAIYTAVNRAVQYAIKKNVTVVAAVGNENLNLDDPRVDNSSPNNGTIIYHRPVDQNCPLMPAGLKNVIGVSAVGNTTKSSTYSNYGLKAVSVTAPGGDAIYPTKFAPNGLILGAFPSYLANAPDNFNQLVRQDDAYYAYLEGTSMATPHVAGIAALIISCYKSDQRPSPRQVQRILEATARPMGCPPRDNRCKTDYRKHTNLFGAGQVDAYAAVRAARAPNRTTASRHHHHHRPSSCKENRHPKSQSRQSPPTPPPSTPPLDITHSVADSI